MFSRLSIVAAVFTVLLRFTIVASANSVVRQFPYNHCNLLIFKAFASPPTLSSLTTNVVSHRVLRRSPPIREPEIEVLLRKSQRERVQGNIVEAQRILRNAFELAIEKSPKYMQEGKADNFASYISKMTGKELRDVYKAMQDFKQETKHTAQGESSTSIGTSQASPE